MGEGEGAEVHSLEPFSGGPASLHAVAALAGRAGAGPELHVPQLLRGEERRKERKEGDNGLGRGDRRRRVQQEGRRQGRKVANGAKGRKRGKLQEEERGANGE